MKVNRADYIPRNDAEFDFWQANLINTLEPNLIIWGILASDFATLKSSQAAWLKASDNNQNCTGSDEQDKNNARDNYEKQLCRFVSQWLTFNSMLPSRERERLGLTQRINSCLSAVLL